MGADVGHEGVDAGCAVPCGSGCCAAGQSCVNGRCEGSCLPESDATFCARSGKVCGPLAGADNCGRPRSVPSCGACEANKACNAAGTACENVCTPETNEAFCSRLGKTCGSVTAADNCGTSRTWNCGSCPTNHACDLATNTCYPTCVDTDRDFCARSGYQCGALSGTDQCGNPRSVAECGPCLATETCDAQHQCRACTPEADADFCTRLGKNCGTVAGTDNCGVPRTVTSCGTCTSPKTCDATNVCATPGVPSNDDCSAAQILAFDPLTWTATATGDTTRATGSGDGSCNSLSGYDVVYEFTLPATKVVEFTATPAGGSLLKPNLYVRSACDQKTAELGCMKTTTVVAGVLNLKLAAGTYFLWVDGYSTTSNGAFTLNAVASDPPPPPANDTCLGAVALTFDTTGKATATGDTRYANHDDLGSCATSSAPFNGGDVVYTFSLNAPQAVFAKVTPDSTATGYAPAVYLRKVCDSQVSTDEVACNKASSGAVTAAATSLQAGTYYVIVDGSSGSGGSFTLEVTTLNPVTNDNCSSPEALVFDASGNASVTGDNTTALHDATGGCGGSGNDVVYTFTTTAAKIFDATVTPAAGSALTPAIYLRSGTSCSAATEYSSTCDYVSGTPGPASVSVASLPAGTYYLWIDGYAGTKGAFKVDVSLGDFAPNDTCSAAEGLIFDANGVATASGDTRRGKGDGDGSCISATGPDLVYSFSTTAEKYVEVEVVPPAGSTLKPNVYLRSACATAATQVACSYSSTAAATIKATVPRLPAGDWYVWVDSYSSTSGGAFALKVTTTTPPPPPANDLCAGALPLVFDATTQKATVTGSTTSTAGNDYAGGCATATAPHAGPDVVYSFTLTAPSMVTAKVTRAAATSAFKPVVYLRKDLCDSTAAADQAACAVDSSGVATATVTKAPAGTYYVIVDGASGTYGDFDLEVALAPPVNLPDDCFSAEEVTLPASGTVTLTGDTTLATNNTKSLIAGTGLGSDVVYKFTTAADVHLTATLKYASTTNYAVVYVRKVCDTTTVADELGAADVSGGGPATVTLKNLPAGTYWVWVDTYSSGKGAYTLTLTTSVPNPPPANDTCATATAVDLSTGSASVQGTTTDARNDYAGSCNSTTGMPGGEVVYAFTVPGTVNQSLVAKVTRASSASTSFQPAVYIRSDCASSAAADEKACAKQSSGVATATVYSLPPGNYFAVVDGLTASDAGAFTLDLALGPERFFPDTCASAQALSFNAAGFATISDDTTTAANDSNSLNCVPSTNGNDLVYKIDTTALGTKNLQARLAFTATGVWPLLYLRSACSTTNTADELACQKASTGGAITISKSALPPGVYYLWVDTSYSSDKGTFTLEVTVSDPRPNDTCSSPQALTFTNDVATDFGLTAGAANDSTGTCAAMTGGDVVYSFTVPGPDPRSVTATVLRDAAFTNFQPAVYLRSNCTSATAADQAACGVNVGGTAMATALSLNPGTYFLIVDGLAATSGAYDLNVQLGPAQAFPDTCASPLPIVFDRTGKAVVQGDTTSAVDDFQSAGCTGTTGNDVVYTLDTTGFGGRDLFATVTYASTTAYPQLSLRAVCASAAATDELACARRSSGGALSLVRYGLAAGVYYLVVDAASTSSKGPFTLDVRLEVPPPPPANDSCANPTELVIDPATGKASVVATTQSGTDDSTGSCSAMNGPDAVYYFTLAQPASVSAKVTRDSSSPAFNPAVYLRTNCSSAAAGDEKACATQTSGVATARHPNLAAGTYYVFVDGTTATFGKYTLEISTGAPVPGDACADAVPLAIDPRTGNATVTGDNTAAANDASGSCGGSGNDLVYTFTTTAPKIFAATATPTSGSALTPTLFLRSGATCAAATEYATTCAYTSSTATSVSVSAASLPAGTYYLWVDGYSGTKGAFTLNVALLDPATNDTCATAEPITLDAATGVGTVSGDTRSGKNDGNGSCLSGTGPDLVYSFALAAPMSVELELSMPAGSPLKPNLYVRSDCPQTSTQVGCAYSSTAGTQQKLVLPRLGAGTWYVWVDSYSSTAGGAFDLKVTATTPPPAPTNDACPGVLAMAYDAATSKFTAAGETTYANHDAGGTCDAATGPDLVYSFTTTQPQKVVAKVVRDSTTATFEPVVYLRAGCDQADALMEVTCAKHTTGTATATVNNLPAGTWYVWVDGAKGTYGKFTAEVALSLPASGPGNDSCFGAASIALPASIPGTVTVAGTTTGAVHEASGTCGSTTTPDVVYSLTLATEQKIVAKVTPTAGASYAPAVYIRRSCGSTASSDQLACASTYTSGSAATATAKYAAPGTYFIWVDSGSTTYASGNFNMDVTLDAPVLPPANNTCAGAEPLTLGVSVSATTADAENTYSGLSSACASAAAPGNDVVYSYTPAADGSFTVTVTPTGFDPVVWMTAGTCGGPSNCAQRADSGSSGIAETMTVANAVAGTTYYLFVDGYSSTAPGGAFTIKVQ